MITVEIKEEQVTTFREQVIGLAKKYRLSADHGYCDDYGFFDEQGKKIKNFIGIREDKVVLFFYNFEERNKFYYDLDKIEHYLKILLKIYDYAYKLGVYSERLEKIENMNEYYHEYFQKFKRIKQYEKRLLNLEKLTEQDEYE